MSATPHLSKLRSITAQRPPESESRAARVARRAPNACERCRKQKIRCSGQLPCYACSRRNVPCRYRDLLDQKITVSKRFLEELQRKAAAWDEARSAKPCVRETANAELRRSSEAHSDRYFDGGVPRVAPPEASEEANSSRSSSEHAALTNLLSTGRSTFMTASNGLTFYLGTSSNWAFTRRILSMTHEHLFQDPLPTKRLAFDGLVYELDWNGSRAATGPPPPTLPTLDHTMFLINAVKFHCGQIFHLFDEETFMPSLYEFYGNLNHSSSTNELWYVHLLLIIAFGKALTSKSAPGKRPPGSKFISRALYLLPSDTMLSRSGVQSVEILCCIALYLQCIDHRQEAHNYIGQAVRIALGQGFHTDMPVDSLGEAWVERARRAWWTVYVLDCQFTSLVGLPQVMHDDLVHSQLPTFPGSSQRRTALSMQIKLSRVIANINTTIYGADGRLDHKFLRATKSSLADTARLGDELLREFPMHLDGSITGLSRIAAHLHLLYHQCVILATRPLLFCFFKIRLESADACSTNLNTSETVHTLIQVCLDSSLQTIIILESLQRQGLLDSFLPFDLDSLLGSTANATLAPVLSPLILENGPLWLRKAYSIFDELISCGNEIAGYRKAELVQLAEELDHLDQDDDTTAVATIGDLSEGIVTDGIGEFPSHVAVPSEVPETIATTPLTVPSPPFSASNGIDDIGFGDAMSTMQIMDIANSIDSLDMEWMSQAIMEHSIW